VEDYVTSSARRGLPGIHLKEKMCMQQKKAESIGLTAEDSNGSRKWDGKYRSHHI